MSALNYWKVILATMVIFGAGVLTGGLVTRHAGARHSEKQTSQPALRGATYGVPNAGGARIEFLRRIGRELDLTPGQRAQVDKILSQSQERTRKLMEPVSPKLRDEVSRAKDRFRAALEPGQQARFDQMLEQQHRPRESRREKLEKPARIPPGGRSTN